MAEKEKVKSKSDKVEKKRKKHANGEKREKKSSAKRQKVANEPFSLLADEAITDPTLSSLFAAKVGTE